MESSVEVKSSENSKSDEKINKTVTFSEPKKSESSKRGHINVKPRGENKRPKMKRTHSTNFRFGDVSVQKSGKRRYSFGTVNEFRSGGKRRRHSGKDGRIILPTKFLLGGNITDPLNLKSLEDEEVNRRLNAVTPQSSPLPTPKHHLQVEVLIPPNIRDPLNLNGDAKELELALLSPNKNNRKKKHKRNRQKSVSDESPAKVSKSDNADQKSEMKKEVASSTESNSRRNDNRSEKQLCLKKRSEDRSIDKIVSPVVPQGQIIKPRKKQIIYSRSALKEGSDLEKFKRKSKKRRHSSGASSTGNSSSNLNFKTKDSLFQHGNYNRYYGYRNHKLESDPRLKCLKREWIEGKDILDIGCNIGHITLTVAKEFSPRKIIGVDIDNKLIDVAKKNVRHYITSEITTPDSPDDFPISMAICYGPIVASAIPQSSHLLSSSRSLDGKFPYNVAFFQGDYVLDSDQQVENQKQEYDLIFALSLTKWIHLNHGDAGIKRAFTRFFNHLRPGGKLVLEAQAWPSYDKKKKLTETIYNNYHSIKFKPEQFTEYLLSKQVGFTTCEVIDTPHNPSKGFRRPIQLFTKAESSPREDDKTL